MSSLAMSRKQLVYEKKKAANSRFQLNNCENYTIISVGMRIAVFWIL